MALSCITLIPFKYLIITNTFIWYHVFIFRFFHLSPGISYSWTVWARIWVKTTRSAEKTLNLCATLSGLMLCKLFSLFPCNFSSFPSSFLLSLPPFLSIYGELCAALGTEDTQLDRLRALPLELLSGERGRASLTEVTRALPESS